MKTGYIKDDDGIRESIMKCIKKSNTPCINSSQLEGIQKKKETYLISSAFTCDTLRVWHIKKGSINKCSGTEPEICLDADIK